MKIIVPESLAYLKHHIIPVYCDRRLRPQQFTQYALHVISPYRELGDLFGDYQAIAMMILLVRHDVGKKPFTIKPFPKTKNG